MYLSSLNAQADDHPEPDPLLREEMEQFQNQIREYVISLIVFIVLYLGSAALIEFYRRKNDDGDGDDDDVVFSYPSSSVSAPRAHPAAASSEYDEDVVVHRISIALCKFSVAVSCGAVFLLPISIFGNEVLFRFPDSYYVKWLNLSLLHTLWNLIFVLANLSLFGLMPFAWFFTEAEGFVGSRRGLWSRFKETCVVLGILFIITFGLATVSLAIFADDDDAKASLFDAWDFYFPRLYSCVSLIGVLILLICTPLGFARIFTVVGQLVVKPRFLRDLDNEVAIVRFEEESLRRKKFETESRRRGVGGVASDIIAGVRSRADIHEYPTSSFVSPIRFSPFEPNLSSEPPPGKTRKMDSKHSDLRSPPNLNQSYDHFQIPNNQPAHSDYYHVRSPFSPPVHINASPPPPSRINLSPQLNHSPPHRDTYSSKSVYETKHFGARSDFQIAYGAAHSQLRNAKSDTRIDGGPGSTSLRGLERSNGHNGLRVGSNCDVTVEGEDAIALEEIEKRLCQVREERDTLEKQQAKPKWQRNLIYPIIMLALLLLTSLSVLMVFANVFELVMGYKALPGDGTVPILGSSSSSSNFGSVGSVIQVVVIFYVMGASIVGLHSAPGIRSITPKPHDTPLTSIIANATLILVLSSAQPLLARTLGLTNFDLLGDYREIRWLRQFYIVLLYNFLFAGATAWCLLKKITGPVRHELYSRLGAAFNSDRYANPVSWMYFVKMPTYPFSSSKSKKV